MTKIVIIPGSITSPDAYRFCGLLVRMFAKWAIRNGITLGKIRNHGGEFFVELGDNDKSYEKLKYNGGIHRFVDISPFDWFDRRHTVFCQVQIRAGNKSETSEENVMSYINSPYTLVKNHITGEETENIVDYFDGRLFEEK